MKSLIILLAFIAPAAAQSLGVGVCVSHDMSTGWTSDENSCLRLGGSYQPPLSPYTVTIIGGGSLPATINSDSVVTAGAVPKCRDGYSLILRSSGVPACARDIIDPE